MTVELHDAGTKLSELADTAANGEEVILVRDGKPVARLTTLAPPTAKKRRLGGLEGYGFKVPDDFNTMGQKEIEEMFYGEE